MLEYTKVPGNSILSISSALKECIQLGGKVLVLGVGGNATTAIHFAAELQGKFEKYENPLPCIDLCSNPAIMTAITNDFGWEHCFSRQIKALGSIGDTILIFSISTKGQYLVNAMNAAAEQSCDIILICGKYTPIPMYRDLGGSVQALVLELESTDTPKVQELQLSLVHKICKQVKKELHY